MKNKKIQKISLLTGLVFSLILVGCDGQKDKTSADASVEASSEEAVADSSEESLATPENQELLNEMQAWIDDPKNQMVLLKPFSSSDEIHWEKILYEAAMRGYLGTPIEMMPKEYTTEYLKLSEKEELKAGVFAITDEEIEAYTKSKVGTACELTKEAAAQVNRTWYRGGDDTFWYCNVSFLHTVTYEYHGIPEYEFECLDVSEDGDQIVLKAKTYAFTNEHEARTEIHLVKEEDGYIAVSNEVTWEEGAVETFPVQLSMFDGEASLAIYDDKRIVDNSSEQPTGEYCFSAAVILNNEVKDFIILENDKDDPLGAITKIDEVMAVDYNFDGVTDLIVTGQCAGGSYNKLFTWEDDTYYGEGYFISNRGLSRYVAKELDNPSAKEILNLLTQGREDKGFANYEEAFKWTAKYYSASNSSDGTLDNGRFELIYFNDDDIPELVAGMPGYRVSVYEYEDGKVYEIIDDWGYGAMGNAGYEYYERTGLIENFDQNGAGAEYYWTYVKLNEETHKMESVLYYHGVNDEEGDYGNPGYFKYVDGEEVEITESEYDSLLNGYLQSSASDTTSYLIGNLTYDEFSEAIDDGNYGYTDYRDAYTAQIQRYSKQNGDKARFALVDVIHGETPELLAEIPGESFSLYTMMNGNCVAILKDVSYEDFKDGTLEFVPGEDFMRYQVLDENEGTEDSIFYIVYIDGRRLSPELWRYGKRDSKGNYSYVYKRDSSFTGFDPQIAKCDKEDFDYYYDLYADKKTDMQPLQSDSTAEEILEKLQK